MEQELKLRKDAEQFKNIFSRSVVLRKPSTDDNTRAIRGVIATELPVIVMDWYRWEPIREVLVVDGANVPDKVPLLDAHSRFEVNNIKGSTANFDYETDDQIGIILTGDNIFSTTAEKEFTLAKEGHLDSTSIGYRVYEKESVIVKPGQEIEIDGRKFRNDYNDGLDLVIRKKWDLLENSLVPIGADKAAKFRSMFSKEVIASETKQSAIIEEIQNAVNEQGKQLKIIINQKEQSKMNEEQKLQDQQRVDAINKLAEKFAGKVKGVDLKDTAELFITSGKTEREFADLIFENQKQQAAVAGPTIPLTEKEVKEYNPIRAVRSLMSGVKCFERELSDEYAKQTGQSPAGIFLLHNAVLPKARQGKRDLTAGTATSAAELVGTDHIGSAFIDYLYEKMVLDNITFLPNRKGNIEIPVLSASAGHGWAATETTAVAEGAPTTTEKTASPKRGGRYIDITKQLMIQSDPAAESLFTNDLIKSLALGVQNAVLNGTGASGQPTGVKNTSGIGSVGSLATMDWDKAVDFETLIDDAFGDGNGMYFVTRRAHAGVLKKRKIDAGSGRFVNENNVVNGYPMKTTNLVTAGDVFFGDWTNVIVPLWDGVDLVIDPYTQATQGLVRITANQLLDVIVRYASAFSYGTDFS